MFCFVLCVSEEREKKHPDSFEGEKNLVDQNLSYIRNGFQAGTEQDKSPLNSPGNSTPELSRSGSLQRTRRSNADNADLMSYLQRTSEEERSKSFDRQNSMRNSTRRRNNKGRDLLMDRERAASPASINNSGSEPGSPTNKTGSNDFTERVRNWRNVDRQDSFTGSRGPSPLVTSEFTQRHRNSNGSDTDSNNRWSNCSSDVSLGDGENRFQRDIITNSSSTPVAPVRRSRYGRREASVSSEQTQDNEHRSKVQQALLDHASGTWKPENNNQSSSFTLHSPEILPTVSNGRPISTYDNIPPNTLPTSPRSTRSTSSARSALSTSTTDTLLASPTRAALPTSPRDTRRDGKVFDDISYNDTSSSPSRFQRSFTLPRAARRQQPSIPSAADTLDNSSIREERREKREAATIPSFRQLRPETNDGPLITAANRSHTESSKLDENVQAFQQKSSESAERRRSKFKGLAARLQSQDDEDYVVPRTRKMSIDVTSASNRSSGEVSDALSSARDDGFESGSVSDHNASTRTSMSSTLESELTTVPAENILSCDDFRTFWVMWETDAILAGHGQYPNG